MERISNPEPNQPKPVGDSESAIRFIHWCVATIGLGYHPDTPFDQYVDAEGRACFTPKMASELDQLQNDAFKYCDPYEVGFSEMQKVEPRLGADFTEMSMEDPAIYPDRGFQRELIRNGTRDQIIQWLSWFDPNGTFSPDRFQGAEADRLTLDQARDIMKQTVDSIGSVIPCSADKVADTKNILAIDTLVRTEKYRHVVAWGKWLGFTPESVQMQVREAEMDDAPADAIQKIDGRWLRFGDINNESNRQRVSDLVAKNERTL